MVLQSSSPRYLVLKVSISGFIILYLSISYVTGQPILTTGLANCGDDVMLTCSQPGFDNSAGRLWKKGAVTISDTGKDASGTDRYSEKSTSNDFSLVISNAMVADIDNYTCEYQFVPSNAESLSFECKPTEWGVDVTRNKQKKLYIQIYNIYPSSITIEVECALQGKPLETLNGTPGTTTQNGDYFDITWMSDDTINPGTYDCTITVETVSSTEIIKEGLTFSDPSLVDDSKTAVIAVSSILGTSVVVLVVLVIVFGYQCCTSKRKISELSQTKNSLEKQNTELKQELENAGDELSQTKNSLEKQVKNLKLDLDKANDALNKKGTTGIETKKILEKQVKDLKQKLEKAVDALNKLCKTVKETTERLEKQVIDLKQELENDDYELEKESQTGIDMNERLEDTVKALEQKYENALLKVSALNTMRKTVIGRTKGLQKQVAGLKQELEKDDYEKS